MNVTVSDKKLVTLLDKHLAAADKIVKSGKLVDAVRLAVIAPSQGFPLQVKFVSGPGGCSDNPAGVWGGGVFQSDQEAPPLGTYRLVIGGKEARLFEEELEVWFGQGQQIGMDGEWDITLDKP